MKYLLTILLMLTAVVSPAQSTEHPAILETILKTYYKNERPVIKGRAMQYLFLYCDKVNNNEELYETINMLDLSKNIKSLLKQQVTTNVTPDTWNANLETVFEGNESLRMKVNECLSLEAFQEIQKKSNKNTHRLMIISKPVFFPDKKTALVKLVFYRTIEHNKGSVLKMEKVGGKWIIKEHLSQWET